MSKSMRVIIAIVVTLLIVSGVGYATYAFFSASATDNSIGGTSHEVDFSVTSHEVYKASSLIPVSEDTIDSALNKADNKCRDNSNRDVCSLYEVNVSNSGVTTSLNGFVMTTSSTYVTNNLKYRVYTMSNGIYTAVTDTLSLSNDSGGSSYFKSNNSNYSITLPTGGNQDYYIVFWIQEINGEQNMDQGKNYSCRIGFEGVNGSKLSAAFNI